MFHCLHIVRTSAAVTRPSRLLSIFRKAWRMDENRSFTSVPSIVLPRESTFSAEAVPLILPVMMS